MNSSVYRNGTSFVESLFDTFGASQFQHGNLYSFACNPVLLCAKFEFKIGFWCFTDCKLGDLKDVTDDLKEDENTQTDTLKKQASVKGIVNIIFLYQVLFCWLLDF